MPVTTAAQAYSSAFQLIWFSRTLGKRKNGPRATVSTHATIRATVSGGSASWTWARHASVSPSATFGSIALSMGLSKVPRSPSQPGVWNIRSGCGSRRPEKNGGDSHRRAASRRARSSLRAGPSWPCSAAIAWTVSRAAL